MIDSIRQKRKDVPSPAVLFSIVSWALVIVLAVFAFADRAIGRGPEAPEWFVTSDVKPPADAVVVGVYPGASQLLTYREGLYSDGQAGWTADTENPMGGKDWPEPRWWSWPPKVPGGE